MIFTNEKNANSAPCMKCRGRALPSFRFSRIRKQNIIWFSKVLASQSPIFVQIICSLE